MSTPEHPQDADPEKSYGANAEPDDNETLEHDGDEVGEAIRRATSDDDAVRPWRPRGWRGRRSDPSRHRGTIGQNSCEPRLPKPRAQVRSLPGAFRFDSPWLNGSFSSRKGRRLANDTGLRGRTPHDHLDVDVLGCSCAGGCSFVTEDEQRDYVPSMPARDVFQPRDALGKNRTCARSCEDR